LSESKRKGGPLRIPTLEEGAPKLTVIDIIEVSIPLINITLTIIFVLLITNVYIDMLLFFMLVLTIAFFFSFSYEFWQRKKTHPTKDLPMIFNSFDISPYVIYTGQFFYGWIFLSFIFSGFIEALSFLSIILWAYFGFSALFLVFSIWAIVTYIQEAGTKKEEIKNKIKEELIKHKMTENYAAQSYYVQLLIKVIDTPLIKARFLSKLITIITILLTIVPFVIPA
jgi:membrane protein implicated in regulation of membrane protease activity